MSSSPVTLSVIVILIVGLISLGNGEECVPRDFGHGSTVCVCNSTYCDSAAVNVPEKGQYRSYESGKDGKRMFQKIGNFKKDRIKDTELDAITIVLSPDEKFQKIHGFGGAFTDATGINMNKLSEESQNRIVESYFGANGSRYSLGRVPIAGTDFSTRPYTYDDNEGDVGLKRFELANEDHIYKIPLMKKARTMCPDLKFVSAAWTAPPWMKTNNNYTGYGFLKKEYYQIYAEYLTKFLVEYKNQGLEIWAITPGNEPADALSPAAPFNTMGWTSDEVAEWVAENLGPTIEASKSNDTIILILDDQRYELPWFIVDVFRNPTAKNYTAGIAVHWYFDREIVPDVIDNTHDLFPDKFLLMTEGCVGNSPWDVRGVVLGNWSRAETYIGEFMQNLNHWITGYIDWNLALDKDGGPNWAKNFVDSPIIVNPETDEFFKQPAYYAIAHFSKFIPRGSTRIGTTSFDRIKNLAFLTPDNEIVIVLYNSDNEKRTIVVTDPQEGNITTNISPYSIKTIIYRL